METCPHGQRIVASADSVVFIDACGECENLLIDLGFSRPQTVARRDVTAA